MNIPRLIQRANPSDVWCWAGSIAITFACAGRAPLYLRLRAGFGAVLQESLFSHGVFYPIEEDNGEADTGSDSADDERAALVLQLLLDSLDASAPNLAHILLGFNVTDGPIGLNHALNWLQMYTASILQTCHGGQRTAPFALICVGP